MDLYAILRRNGWRSPEALKEAAARSIQVRDEEMPDDVRWIRSYASHADLPVDEIIPVADTVVIRPDPAPLAA